MINLPAREVILRLFSKNIAYVAFLLLVIFFSITVGDKFLTVRNWSLILEQLPVLALLALGMTFIITGGFIDLSVGSALGMASLIGALGAQQFGVVGLLLGVLAGIVIGAINGAIFTFLKIPSFLVTLGMMVILRALVAIISGGFAVYLDQVNAPGLELLTWLGRFPQVTIILLLITIVVTILYSRGVFGQNLMAMGGDERAVARFGVSGKYRRQVPCLGIHTVGHNGRACERDQLVSARQFGAAGPRTGTGMEAHLRRFRQSCWVEPHSRSLGVMAVLVKTVFGAMALIVLADGLIAVG